MTSVLEGFYETAAAKLKYDIICPFITDSLHFCAYLVGLLTTKDKIMASLPHLQAGV